MATIYEVELDLTVVGVEVGIGVPGAQGPAGPQGDPGIYVGSTPPPSPSLNDLWVEIP